MIIILLLVFFQMLKSYLLDYDKIILCLTNIPKIYICRKNIHAVAFFRNKMSMRT